MATVNLPPDFTAFLQLLSAHHVEYLLIGGYAVAYHGYSRAIADMAMWSALHPHNADKVVALNAFGFDLPELSPVLFLKAGQIIRIGVPPLRIKITTSLAGVRRKVDRPQAIAGRFARESGLRLSAGERRQLPWPFHRNSSVCPSNEEKTLD